MQVFLAKFTSAPRWVFTRRCFVVGRRADWAFRTRGLPFDVLKAVSWALHTKTGLCVVAMFSSIAPKTHRISTGIDQCGGAEWALCAFGGVQNFRCPTLWTLVTVSNVFKGARCAWGSATVDTSLDRYLSVGAWFTGHGPIFVFGKRVYRALFACTSTGNIAEFTGYAW
jgi:hypothetical protein